MNLLNFDTTQFLPFSPLSAHQDQNIIMLSLMRASLERQLQKQLLINLFLQNTLPNPQIYQQQSQNIKNYTSNEKGTQDNQDCQSKQIIKNETKNIPKNFGKAIISFIQKNQRIIKKILKSQGVNYQEYVSALKTRKRDINSIADLRSLWIDTQFKFAKVTRIISVHFLKRGSPRYIFNSRITNHIGHIKYRNRLIQVLKKPQQFTNIKIY